MRFCEKCGKEIPDEATECTCCYEQEVSENTSQTFDEFSDAIKNSKTINILGIVVLLLGIVSVLFINGWLGAVLFFVAEIFVLVPNSKVQKLCKSKNPEADKKAKQAFLKETTKRLKSEDKNFKFSFIIGYVCLACLILSFIVPSPIISAKSNSENVVESDSIYSEDWSYEETTQIVPQAYYPTVDELVGDYYDVIQMVIGQEYSLSNSTEEGEGVTVVTFDVDGFECATLECVITDGKVSSVNVDVNMSVLRLCMYDKDDNYRILFSKTMTLAAPVLLVMYQNPSKYSDYEAFSSLMGEIDDLAISNYYSNGGIYTVDTSYENCSISYYATSSFEFFSCSCTVYDM